MAKSNAALFLCVPATAQIIPVTFVLILSFVGVDSKGGASRMRVKGKVEATSLAVSSPPSL